MRDVFIAADNIISPLGITTEANFTALLKEESGVQEQFVPAICDEKFYASLLNNDEFIAGNDLSSFTRFEQLLIASIKTALETTTISLTDERTILIISSTKGNISLIEDNEVTPAIKNRVALHTSAKLIGEYFSCVHAPLVISNACISGLVALLTGMRLIQSGRYDHAVVAGADLITKFILSGFQSFQAISSGRCKPFDAARNGINLGEGAATIVLSATNKATSNIRLSGGSVSNDANHISGPSRTGEELYQAISKSMHQAGLQASNIGFISAHGTATVYNDEMETLALSLADLNHVPVNSLKGYYGHTLGAAGLIESVVAIQSLVKNIVLPSHGFQQTGVSKPLNVATTVQHTPIQHCLKTASGFGGCNAALIFSKTDH